MSTNQLTPIWLIQDGNMASSITSGQVPLLWEDNVGIQAIWTGTPTGTLDVQLSLDPINLGWQTITSSFSPTPSQPSGSSGSNFYELNQTCAGYIRMIYTRSSGTGTLNVKISAKSV